MFELTKYVETAKNLDEASGKYFLETLGFFSGCMAFIVVVPIFYITTNVYFTLVWVLIGFINLFGTQWLTSKLNFEQENEENEDE
jgi:phosphotransferase system  glucose/maltose/N-acetylglucosamine-specific IIC component